MLFSLIAYILVPCSIISGLAGFKGKVITPVYCYSSSYYPFSYATGWDIFFRKTGSDKANLANSLKGLVCDASLYLMPEQSWFLLLPIWHEFVFGARQLSVFPFIKELCSLEGHLLLQQRPVTLALQFLKERFSLSSTLGSKSTKRKKKLTQSSI